MASPALLSATAPWWKKLAVRAFFFGIGVAAICALVVAGFLLYEHHLETKPWTSPMKATFTGAQFGRDTEAITIWFQYAIENPTDKDYQFPPGSTIMMLLPEGGGYRAGEQAHVTWENSTFIPAKHKVNIKVVWSIPSTEFTLPPGDMAKAIPFTNRRLTENDGFAIFDQKNRYRIDLPNVWKDWPDVKKILEEDKQKQP